MTNAAIYFEPDGYLVSGSKLMGRQAAGNAFLRAAISGRGEEALHAYTPNRRSAEVFHQIVQAQEPGATVSWIPADRLDALAKVGTLYLPGPALDHAARLRLRVGCDAYSLVGVTHTTASHGAMDSIVGMLAAPVMPWDALICTSTAVASTVKVLLEAEIDALRWRFGAGVNFTLPQFPIIPLGVHCADFEFSETERRAARAALGIESDEVVALFVGRLSFHAKAHPHAMYAGLQSAAARSAKKVILIQCGWFANDAINRSFVDGTKQFCPDVKSIFTDGKDSASRRQSWAAADLFISLSDNIQETFGLTPIEAMAAGLPVVVTDWDGYKDTVRDGIDGFRIPTWMPPPNLGDGFAKSHEAKVDSYDFYCGLTCQTVSMDGQVLVERLSDLISQPDLRQRLGKAGQERARQVFDWAVVYRQYQSLYDQLGKIRRAAKQDAAWQVRLASAPRAAASRMDPYRSFAHYPTELIQPQTMVATVHSMDNASYESLAANDLFNYAGKLLPSPEHVQCLLKELLPGACTVETLSKRAGFELGATILALSVLAKMGLVHLSAPKKS